MTITNAKRFIRKAMVDQELRGQLNAACDEEKRMEVLESALLRFNYGEFENAYYNTLTECQTEEAAEHVKSIKLWWDFLQISDRVPQGT